MKRYTPSILTSLNLLLGFVGIVDRNIQTAALIILVCIILDVFDGRAARHFKAQSDMGKELDSLADLVSFGVLPATIYFTFSPLGGVLTYVFPALIVLGSALRLARFNTLSHSDYFMGLPTPASALFFSGLFFSHGLENDFTNEWITQPVGYVLIPLFFFIMMLAPVRMMSFKGKFTSRKDYLYPLILLGVFIITWVFVHIGLAIQIAVILYIVLSFIQNFFRLESVQKKGKHI